MIDTNWYENQSLTLKKLHYNWLGLMIEKINKAKQLS